MFQKSDFICTDEHGYPIDSSHLDNNDEDGDDDQNIQNQESDTIQTILHTGDTGAKHPSPSIDSPSEYPDQPDATSREEDKNQRSGITASATHEDTHETPALGEQGGSPSSSWLGSSVTGWLGLGKEEQTVNMPEREEPQAEASLTSSVTGWLGFGGENKLDDTKNNREEDKEGAASLTTTMTGWLGLGGEKKTDHATKEQHEEREVDGESEPKEIFRSRRMSLDLEGSRLQEDEREVGTLHWLGKGLSSTLGLTREAIKKEKEKPTSSSWLDIGVRDILGFVKSERGVDKSHFKETEKYTSFGEATHSDQADISQTQPVQEEQKKTEPNVQKLEEKVTMEALPEMETDDISSSSSRDTDDLNVEEHVVDHFSHSETVSDTLTEDFNNNNTAASRGSEGISLSVDAAARGDQKTIPPQTTSEEKLQALGRTTLMIEEGSAEANGEGHQIHKSTGNGFGNNNRDLEEEEIKTASDDSDCFTQPNTDLESDRYAMDSKGQYVANTGQQENKTAEHLESTTSLENVYLTLPSGEEGSRGERQSSSSHTGKEETEPTHSDDDSVTASSVNTGNLDTVSGDSRRERESDNVRLQNGASQSFHSTNTSLYENSPDNQMLAILDKDPEPGSLDYEEGIAIKEKEKQEGFDEKREANDGKRQQGVEKKEKDGKIKEEEVQKEAYELQKKEKLEDVKEIKEEEKRSEMEDVKEVNPDGQDKLQDEEIQEGVDDVQEEMRQEKIDMGEENKKQEVKELKEEEKGGDEEMVEVERAKEEEEQDILGDSEKSENEQQVEAVALMEEQQQDEVESLDSQKVLREVEEEEKQNKTKEFQVEEKEADIEDSGIVKEENEQKENEKKKQEENETLKEEEKQEMFNKLNGLKEEETDEETTAEVPHLETTEKNIHDIGQPEFESSEETHNDNTKTEENNREKEQVTRDNMQESKEEKRAGEEMQQLTDVEGERKEKEQEENHKWSNKPEDEPAGVRNEYIKPSSADVSMIQENKQIESGTMSSEGMDTNRLTEKEVEKASHDSEADGGEKPNITLNATGNENNYSNKIKISDHNGLKVEHIGVASQSDNDQHLAGESGHSGHLNGTSLGKTLEMQEHDQQAQNDMSQAPNTRVKIESESGGALGLFKNAVSFFSQTPVTKTKEPTASTVGLATAEPSPPQAFLTLQQESDSTELKSNQVPVQENPISISIQQHTPAPPLLSPQITVQTKSLSKYYTNLLGHVSVEELAYLLDLFGQNKLQFLDYIVGSSENQTDDPDSDESILSDIERLLHHHRETQSMSQQVNEKTKTLDALQKLEMLLEKLTETLNSRKSDVSKANLQGIFVYIASITAKCYFCVLSFTLATVMG